MYLHCVYKMTFYTEKVIFLQNQNSKISFCIRTLDIACCLRPKCHIMQNITFGHYNTFLCNLTCHINWGEQYTLLHGCHESLSKDKRRYTSERGSVDGNGDGDGDGADVVVGRQAALGKAPRVSAAPTRWLSLFCMPLLGAMDTAPQNQGVLTFPASHWHQPRPFWFTVVVAAALNINSSSRVCVEVRAGHA